MDSFNQHQINALVGIAQRKKAVVKRSSATDTLLKKYGIGQEKAKNMIGYDSSDVQTAIDWCDRLGIDFRTYDSKAGTREERGLQQANEKGSSVSVYSKFIPITTFGEVMINGVIICMPDCGFALITPSEVKSIVADGILLVENLETFTNQIDRIRHILPVNCLVVFRGSRHFGGNTEKSVLRWRNEYTLAVTSFYDYDISGLIKQSERDWDYWILPKMTALTSSRLTGSFEDLEKQKNELNLKHHETPIWLASHIEVFERLGGSFTQERLIGNSIELEIVSPCREAAL
jgi:hypothetical protein